MDNLVENNMPYGICHYVYQELLQGAASKREYDSLKEYLSTLPFYELLRGKESFEDAAYMYMNCRKHGITVRSTIDLLIAQIAIENATRGKEPEKPFKGSFNVRISADLHRRLALTASARGVSLNTLVENATQQTVSV
jgi:hypothetical protein